MRSLGSELSVLATVMAIPAWIGAIFPYSAIEFHAKAPAAAMPSAAFVSLTAEEEASAMRAAKASWQGAAGGALQLRADLSLGELPTGKEPAVLGDDARTRPPRPGSVAWEPPPYLPSQAAPPPQKISDNTPPPPPTFPRKEMLEMR